MKKYLESGDIAKISPTTEFSKVIEFIQGNTSLQKHYNAVIKVYADMHKMEQYLAGNIVYSVMRVLQYFILKSISTGVPFMLPGIGNFLFNKAGKVNWFKVDWAPTLIDVVLSKKRYKAHTLNLFLEDKEISNISKGRVNGNVDEKALFEETDDLELTLIELTDIYSKVSDFETDDTKHLKFTIEKLKTHIKYLYKILDENNISYVKGFKFD